MWVEIKIADKQCLPANTLKYDFIHTHKSNIGN